MNGILAFIEDILHDEFTINIIFYQKNMKLRACLIGAPKCGKSHFIGLLKDHTHHTYRSTIGVDFCSYKIDKDSINIWDTAGSTDFSSITYNFIRNVNLLICMYKDEESARWIQDYLNTHDIENIDKIVFIYKTNAYNIDTDIEHYSVRCTFSKKSAKDCIDFIFKINRKETHRSYCFW